MKRTLLIDTDSKVPSLPILKYSSHRKASGHEVELQRLKYNGYFRKGRQSKVVTIADPLEQEEFAPPPVLDLSN